jgi:hypothetical protein
MTKLIFLTVTAALTASAADSFRVEVTGKGHPVLLIPASVSGGLTVKMKGGQEVEM